MDIEKIKKINEMSRQLRNHHFAMSSDEAIQDARKIYDEELNLEIAPARTESSQVQAQAPLTNVPLLEKKFQILLDQNFKSFKADLTNLQETVEFLQQELSKLHQRVSKLQQPVKTVVIEKLQEPQTSVEKPVREFEEEAPRPAPVQKKVEEVKQSHPRSGDLTSKDVSIEKFFYFGNGR